MKFKIPELPYSKEDLEPCVSSDTVDYHYNKHTKKYYDTTNKLIKDTIFEKSDTLEDIIKHPSLKPNSKMFNNVCQAWNHTFFWEGLQSFTEDNTPTIKVLNDTFGSFDEFKKIFEEKAKTVFGSGWIWLIEDNGLKIVTTKNADTPLYHNQHPLLVLDLWEHAWYLDYPAVRDTYVSQWWNIVNWDIVNKRLNERG